jgi:hypothetical protein
MNVGLILFLLLAIVASHVFYLSWVMRRQQRSAEKAKLAIEPNVTIKQIVRADGKERVRIIRVGEAAFGAVLERHHKSTGEWLLEVIVAPGAVFDSADVAESEAARIAPWVRPDMINA